MRRHRPSQQQQGGDRREDRVDYDLQQALAMRGHHQAVADATACAARDSTSPGSASSPASSKGVLVGAPRSPPAGTGRDTSTNVGVALRGLDRAEELERSGDLEQALEIYQLAIEGLISYLNGSNASCSPSRGGGSRNDGPGLDREVVAERCRVALSDAERIKGKLDRQKKKADAGLTGYFSSALPGWQTQGTHQSREKSPTRSTNRNHRQAASEEEDAGRRKKRDDTKSSSRRTSASLPTAA